MLSLLYVNVREAPRGKPHASWDSRSKSRKLTAPYFDNLYSYQIAIAALLS